MVDYSPCYSNKLPAVGESGTNSLYRRQATNFSPASTLPGGYRPGAGWYQQIGAKKCWLSLDSGDNSPVVFWAYFIAALQTPHPATGAGKF